MVLDEAIAFCKAGYNVTLITSNCGGEIDKTYPFTIIRVSAWNPLERFGIPYPIFLPILLPVLFREIQKSDALHIHGLIYQASFWASRIARLLSKPYCITEHTGFISYPKAAYRFLEWIAFQTIGRITACGSQHIFTLNEHIQGFIRTLYHGNTSVFIPGVDTEKFHPVSKVQQEGIRKRLHLPVDKPIVLFTGRFIEKKGFDLVTSIQTNAWTTVCVGRGVANKNSHASNLEIRKEIPFGEIQLYYQAADIFLIPSHGEGFPVSIKEALSCGLPVIVTDNEVNRRYLSSSCALFTHRNTKDIERGIKSALHSRKKLMRMKQAARKYALSHFSGCDIHPIIQVFHGTTHT